METTSTTGAGQDKTQQPQTQVAVLQKNIADQVLDRINAFQESGQLKLPQDYHVGNALKSAMLLIQDIKTADKRPVLEACSGNSIAFALQKMVVLGLNPLKKQCNFIAYGTELKCETEYSADEMLAKRYGMKDITKTVVYKDDEFEDTIDEETGHQKVIKHHPCSIMKRTKNDIIGAYATVTMQDGSRYNVIMNMEEIRDAWNQGPMKGQSPAHRNFPGEMSKKTVSRRATKSIIRSSDDAALYKDDKTIDDEVEYEDKVANNVKQQISQNANKTAVSFSTAAPAEIVEEKKTEQKQEIQQPEQKVEEKQPAQQIENSTQQSEQQTSNSSGELFPKTGVVTATGKAPF